MIKTRFGFLAIFFVGFTACTTVQPIVGPDGSQAQLIKGCPSVEDCYTKARETCKGNYKIVNSNSEKDEYGYGTVFDLLVRCDH